MLTEVNRIMKPFPVYLVGGAVRDYLLGIEPKDYDFTTPATPDEIEACIHSKSMKVYAVGKKFGTLGCKVKIDEKYYPIEITTFRTEKYEPGNRKPEVEFVKSVSEDLSRRDFTINAICARLDGERLRIIDPFNGREDLKNKLIRCVGNPKLRFKEDPLRILRAIRFSCRFNYEIEPQTMKKLKEGAIQILNISKERWIMELDKILLSENVGKGLLKLWETGLFKYIIPELDLQYNYDQNSQYHNYLLHQHTIKVVEAVRNDLEPYKENMSKEDKEKVDERNLIMLWGALLHDLGKPFLRTDKVISNKETPMVTKIETKSNYIGHEILGADMVKRIALHFKWSNERKEKVVKCKRNCI